VLVADDDPVIRLFLTELISDDDALELVGAVGRADEAVALAVAKRPDVALVDVRMPGDGVTAAEGIRNRAPGTRVIALSAHNDRTTVLEMLEAGAVGYLVKDASVQTIIESIRRAAEGQGSLAGAVTAGVIDELVEQRADKRRAEARHRESVAWIRRAIDQPGAFAILLQPICSLQAGAVVGVEALSRFSLRPSLRPDRWFAEAATIGLGRELELVAIDRALALLPRLPKSMFLSVNASPATVSSDEFSDLIARCDAARVVVEVTEVAPIDDYEEFGASLSRVREQGVRLAVDDAGAGFASLRHILQLVPDLIKLDRTLIAGIEGDRARQALAAGLISFAGHLGASIIAEGIELEGQLTALCSLGVGQGQGFFLCHPQAPDRLDKSAWKAIEHRIVQALATT
jgi:EAL domain-containing protein (putative c-di-GMP-specific phosphodiesterase class I)/CheY-like chemotaxis protein